MPRLSKFWNNLSVEERSRLIYLERSDKKSSGYGGGGMLPDDCGECGACSQPHLGTGLCSYCLNELIALCDKGNGKINPKILQS